MFSLKIKSLFVNYLCIITSCAFAVSEPPSMRKGLIALDKLDYLSNANLQAKWKASEKKALAKIIRLGSKKVAELPCPFSSSKAPRAFWDIEKKIDFSKVSAVSFDVYIENPSALGTFTFYLMTPNGYYWHSWRYPRRADQKWYHVNMPLTSFSSRSKDGLNAVTSLRISPWRQKKSDAKIYFTNLAVDQNRQDILVLGKNDRPRTIQYMKYILAYFDDMGISYQMFTGETLLPKQLAGVKLLVIPYYPNMPESMSRLIAEYMTKGGKVISVEFLPRPIGNELGAEVTAFPAKVDTGKLKYNLKYIYTKNPPLWVPEKIVNVFMIPKFSKITDKKAVVKSWWLYRDGEKSGIPALITSPSGAYLSCGFFNNRDAKGHRRLLLWLLAEYLKDGHEKMALRELKRTDDLLDAGSWKETCSMVRKLKEFNSEAAEELKQAEASRNLADKLFKQKQYLKSIKSVIIAREHMRKAFYISQECGSDKEFKGMAFQHADGLAGGDWDESVKAVKDGGLTDIVVNLQGGCSLSYPSDMLPYFKHWHCPRVQNNFKLCREACIKYGIRLHVWTSNMKLLYCPDEQRKALDKAGRLQKDAQGKSIGWLCPTHPENIDIQKKIMVYAAKQPGVAGLHFDYIRYEQWTGCYCPRCREKFENWLGRKIKNWPAGILNRKSELSKKFNEFRCNNITRIVEKASKAIRKSNPKIIISGAFAPYPQSKNDHAQDWMKWVKEGYIDFVLPMTYTNNDNNFAELVNKAVTSTPVSVYPYIAYYVQDPVQAIKQIQIARNTGAKGWCIFSMAARGEDLLKALKMGVTKAQKEK